MEDFSKKNIEEVVVGDKVMTFDFTTNEQVAKEVLKVKVKEQEETFILETDTGVKVEATPDHPFHTENKGWVALDIDLCKTINGMDVLQLEVGDVLHTNIEKKAIVTKLEKTNSKKKVFNLEDIKDNHNFYVNGFLVHNRYK